MCAETLLQRLAVAKVTVGRNGSVKWGIPRRHGGLPHFGSGSECVSTPRCRASTTAVPGSKSLSPSLNAAAPLPLWPDDDAPEGTPD